MLKGTDNVQQISIGVVTAEFNLEITEKLEQGAFQYFKEHGLSESHIFAVRVPGAYEIPLAVQALLKKGCDGVVALGAVIRGDTAHFEYVCNSVERGCTQLQLEFGRPVAFGVLTTDTDQQALDRAGGAHGNKGYEAAQVAIQMINLTRQIEKLPNPKL